jgi:hypothetical protein
MCLKRRILSFFAPYLSGAGGRRRREAAIKSSPFVLYLS